MKELIDLCEQKLAGTKYDKFWVQSIIKRYNTTEKVQVLVDFLSTCEHKDAWQDWITDELKSDAEKQKKQLEALKKEQQEVSVESSGWTKEEIALLTKGVVKFPPGTKERW